MSHKLKTAASSLIYVSFAIVCNQKKKPENPLTLFFIKLHCELFIHLDN